MLRKLLKYDFKELIKVCIPLYIMGVVAFILCEVLDEILVYTLDMSEGLIQTIFSLLILIASQLLSFSISLIAVFIAGWIIVDFYKSVFGKSGYLTHTLPVSTADIFWSKTISSSIILCLTLLFTGVLSIIDTFIDMNGEYEWILEWLRSIYLYASAETIYLTAGLIILLVFTMIRTLISVYASIALGHLTKYRVAMSIVIYLIVNNIATLIVLTPSLIYLAMKFTSIETVNLDLLMELGHGVMIGNGLTLLLTVVLGYITYRIMDRKLNLI